jgi:BlaR1 peptidase M56
LRSGAALADDDLIECCAAFCRQMRVRRAPQLSVAEAVGSPVLLGGSRPVICLPRAMLSSCTGAELRLILAHELAHWKRRDLFWAWLPTVGGTLFFFHPLVWLAGREWWLAQELACDELAIRITGAPALEYGQMVLKVAAQRRTPVFPEPAAASAAGAYRSMWRRLVAIQQIRPCSSRRWRPMGALLTITGLVLLVPWRLTARADAAQPLRRRPAQVRIVERASERQRMATDHERRLAEEAHIRRLQFLAHQRRLAEIEHRQRLMAFDHARRQAEQDAARQIQRRQAEQEHARRLVELEQKRRLEIMAHEQRLMGLEHARQLGRQAHEQRAAEQEMQRRQETLAHIQRLMELQRAHQLGPQAREQGQAGRDRIRDLATAEHQQRLAKLQAVHRLQEMTLQQRLMQSQRQVAEAERRLQFLTRQLAELRAEQAAMRAQHQRIQSDIARERQVLEQIRRLRQQPQAPRPQASPSPLGGEPPQSPLPPSEQGPPQPDQGQPPSH